MLRLPFVCRRLADTSSLSLFLAVLLAGLSLTPLVANAAAPGDTTSVVTLNANFDADNPNAAPNLTLPGNPAGDYLTLDLASGTVKVIPSYDGLSRPVEIRQVNDPGGVALNAFPAPIPAPAEKVTVRWRSVARDDEAIILIAFAVRASNGATLASVEYLHQGELSYNGMHGQGQLLPVTQPNRRAQQFTIDVDFLTRTTSLSIDGSPVAGFQSVPFAQAGDDVARLSAYGEGGHPQTVYVDDISMVARYRVPDHGPAVTAPASVSGTEQSAVNFSVSASDADGDAIASLTASPLPTGASFTPNGTNTSGAFAWTPDYSQAGAYAVTFTAANALSGSATTNLTIANLDRAPVVTGPATASGAENALLTFTISAADADGDAITSLAAGILPQGASFVADPGNGGGAFAWTPGFAQAGSYSVTFTAQAGGASGTLTTAITIANADRAPIVAAPTVVDGEEGGVLLFDVTASDPDGDALAGLGADLAALPSGHGATFTPAADYASGTFRWPMKQGEAGSYLVTFTATNGSSGSAVTRINVAFAGTTITGELIWTPQPGEEGTYNVTFTARNSLNETGSSTTTIVVTPSLSSTTGVTTTTSSDGRTGILAPSAVNKGPIVSSTGLISTQTKSTLTVSATAREDTSISLVASHERVNAAGSTTSATADIISFNADLSGLPAGNNAIFTLDQEPVVSAPASITVNPGDAIGFTVSASDPDADPLFGLAANLSVLPAGNTATFTPNGTFTSGAFAWTPRAEDAGTFAIEFTAFNALVGKATTSVTVRAVAPARVFLAGSKKIRLSSNRPFGCVQIEPVNAAFSLLDIDLTSIRMISIGTGTVSEIAATSTKSAVIGDRDNNLIEDIQICFSKSDFRALFSLLRGQNSVPVIVRGRLVSGALFQGSVTLDIQAGGGALMTVMSPNPLNPSGMLSFITKTPGAVRVTLFDLNGRFVRTLWESRAAAPGAHEVPVEARGADGRALSSGVYFFRIESRDGVDTGRFTVLK
ncbi:MAG TPA: putative Ig domain-containing protein [Candidatus Eisenbacteria bacterium]|nr:putative Ig domain-containing protein [Candidatus Eisenbacteria bacterium]